MRSEQFMRYEDELNAKMETTHIGPEPARRVERKVIDATDEVHDRVELGKGALSGAVTTIRRLIADTAANFVGRFTHRLGQAPFSDHHNMYRQADAEYDIINERGSWFVYDLPWFVQSLDRTSRESHNVTAEGAPDNRLIGNFPGDLHLQVLMPLGGPLPWLPQCVQHQAYYGSAVLSGGTVGHWQGTAPMDDDVIQRASMLSEFSYDLFNLRFERSKVATAAYRESKRLMPENVTTPMLWCYKSVPSPTRHCTYQPYDIMYLQDRKKEYMDAWQYN